MTTTARTATVRTPIGPFTVIATDAAAGKAAGAGAGSGADIRAGSGADIGADAEPRPTVLASGWTSETAGLMPLIAPELRPAVLRTAARIDGITDAILAYHGGDVHAIDTVPVRQCSGSFFQQAWDVLRAVPAGTPVTYTEFAARAGRPTAVRAAGSACAHNAAALFVPCHRVVPASGGVGSFRWGPSVKAWLLDREAGGK